MAAVMRRRRILEPFVDGRSDTAETAEKRRRLSLSGYVGAPGRFDNENEKAGQLQGEDLVECNRPRDAAANVRDGSGGRISCERGGPPAWLLFVSLCTQEVIPLLTALMFLMSDVAPYMPDPLFFGG